MTDVTTTILAAIAEALLDESNALAAKFGDAWVDNDALYEEGQADGLVTAHERLLELANDHAARDALIFTYWQKHEEDA